MRIDCSIDWDCQTSISCISYKKLKGHMSSLVNQRKIPRIDHMQHLLTCLAVGCVFRRHVRSILSSSHNTPCSCIRTTGLLTSKKTKNSIALCQKHCTCSRPVLLLRLNRWNLGDNASLNINSLILLRNNKNLLSRILKKLRDNSDTESLLTLLSLIPNRLLLNCKGGVSVTIEVLKSYWHLVLPVVVLHFD